MAYCQILFIKYKYLSDFNMRPVTLSKPLQPFLATKHDVDRLLTNDENL